MKKRSLLLSAVFVGFSAFAFAENDAARNTVNPLLTGIPSLHITPDTRAGGMGDVGAATTPDINSQYWNASKYAFMESSAGLSVSYTPWLRKLVPEIDLAYLSGYYKFDELQAVSASFRYFSLGNITLTDMNQMVISDVQPYELAFDLAYSRKLSDYLSAAVAFRFMLSDLNNGANYSGAEELYPGWALAADVSAYYNRPIAMTNGDAKLAFGVNLSNLGSKITYDKTISNFIPANLRIGGSFDMPIDAYNRISFSADINKLMVPSIKSKYAKDYDPNDSNTWRMTSQEYSDMSSLQGMFRSFADSPDGFMGELREIQWGIGAEYAYNQQFFVRAGYSHESKQAAGRRFFTVGAGFKLNMFQLDAGYVIATAQNSPLDQTLRFTLSFDLFGLKSLMQ